MKDLKNDIEKVSGGGPIDFDSCACNDFVSLKFGKEKFNTRSELSSRVFSELRNLNYNNISLEDVTNKLKSCRTNFEQVIVDFDKKNADVISDIDTYGPM